MRYSIESLIEITQYVSGASNRQAYKIYKQNKGVFCLTNKKFLRNAGLIIVSLYI